MNTKIKEKSELSKLLSVKTRISDESNFVALSTNLGAVPFRRTLSDGRASTRGFFRPLPASLRRPLFLASCGLSRSFVRLIRPLVGADLCTMRRKCTISSKRHKKTAA